MKEWYLYMIRDETNALYTGVTTDINRRFEEHVLGGRKAAKYLAAKKNLEIVLSCKIGEKQEAYRIEAKIKSLSKQRKEEIVAQHMTLFELRHYLF